MNANMGGMAANMAPMPQGLGMNVNVGNSMAAPSQLISNQQMMSQAM